MAPSPACCLPPFSFAGASLSSGLIMLALLQTVCALSLSNLLYQAAASPLLHESYVPGHTGAVASESDICSHIGIDLLERGGNAADAVCSRPMNLYKLLT
jgi:hypothetical protein